MDLMFFPPTSLQIFTHRSRERSHPHDDRGNPIHDDPNKVGPEPIVINGVLTPINGREQIFMGSLGSFHPFFSGVMGPVGAPHLEGSNLFCWRNSLPPFAPPLHICQRLRPGECPEKSSKSRSFFCCNRKVVSPKSDYEQALP